MTSNINYCKQCRKETEFTTGMIYETCDECEWRIGTLTIEEQEKWEELKKLKGIEFEILKKEKDMIGYLLTKGLPLRTKINELELVFEGMKIEDV